MIKTILKWAGALVLVVALGATGFVGFVAHRLGNSLPPLEGQAPIAGADGVIEIVRDRYGVPHIFATSDHDAARGLGFAHAQDRFFQMDATRRVMQGRLSELVGARTLALDAQARTMDWAGVAQAQYDALSPEAKAWVEAYAQGVNAALAVIPTPPEYALFFAKPEPWAPVDSVAASLAMTDQLTGGENIDRGRAMLGKVLTPEQVMQFMPGYPAFAPRSYAPQDTKAALAPGLENDKPGSNAWVVSGARTGTGKPVLANDPHLPLGAPGPFYLSRLHGPRGAMIGASLPGAPAIVIGRTNVLAWGTTTHQIDAADDLPLTPQMNVTTTTALIKVRTLGLFHTTRKITIRRTPEGPVMDPKWFDLEEVYGDTPMVLRTIADDRDNGLTEAIFQAGRAANVDAYFEALKPWTAPPQNLVVADSAGNIGLISPARYPKRTADGAWDGEVPARILAKNPANGFFATANNLQTPADFPFPMPGGHDPYRVTRITDVLIADSAHNADRAAALQMDRVSVLAGRLKNPIAIAVPETRAGRTMQARLMAWDGVANPEAKEPTFFAYWTRALGLALYGDELGPELFEKFQGPRDAFLDAVLNGAAPAAWCDDVTSPATIETCPQIVGRALDAAAAMIRQDLGEDETKWTWGPAHSARFPHPLLAAAPFVGKDFVVTTPLGGNSTTVNVARNWHNRDDYQTVHAAGLRMIVDFADLESSRFMVAPGQSGHPRSPHYGDLAPLWAEGAYFEIRSDWAANAAPEGAKKFTLQPKK